MQPSYKAQTCIVDPETNVCTIRKRISVTMETLPLNFDSFKNITMNTIYTKSLMVKYFDEYMVSNLSKYFPTFMWALLKQAKLISYLSPSWL